MTEELSLLRHILSIATAADKPDKIRREHRKVTFNIRHRSSGVFTVSSTEGNPLFRACLFLKVLLVNLFASRIDLFRALVNATLLLPDEFVDIGNAFRSPLVRHRKENTRKFGTVR